MLRIGNGYDLHRLAPGRRLVIGGVEIPFEKGCVAHSDGDVAAHALIDALLGAAALGDIGTLFPDTDPAWKNADSLDLLRRATELLHSQPQGWTLVNADITIILQRPKLASHIESMRARLAAALGCDIARISCKAKTNEDVDALGRGDAIAAWAVAIISARH